MSQSALERYRTDTIYKNIVDSLEHLLHTANLTPSEMREAAILASIRYEHHCIGQFHIPLTEEMHTRLNELHKLVNQATPH